ncbi:MAG TPA: family 20 glycosylhydrolase [Clostridiaceae bacterium]|nr:family 20 glycosylhydrolase [Clostridiaceae bacterium]
MKYDFIPLPKKVVYNDSYYHLPDNTLYITASQKLMKRLRAGINDFCKELKEFCNIYAEGILAVTPLKGHINLIVDDSCELNDEGYLLEIKPEGIYIISKTAHGLYYGMQTLTQIFKQVTTGKELRGIRIEDEPALKVRGMMLDLRMQTFKIDYLLKFVRTLAHYKINTLTIEYSDKFPYYGEYEVIRNPDCFSEEEVATLVEYCHDHFVDIIPFVQCFGHMEYILRTEKYRYLREVDEYDSQICPLNPDSLKVTKALLQQVMRLHKYTTHLSIGGDEPYHLGECPRCADYATKYGKGGLYVYYANQLCRIVKDMGLSTSICADKLLAYPDIIDFLSKDFIILDWDYWTYNDNPTKIMNWNTLKMVDRAGISKSSPEMKKFIQSVSLDEKGNMIPFAYSRYFSQKGFNVIGLCSTASIGPDGYWVPHYDVHIPNINSFCKYIKEYGGLGIINTAWERFLFELVYYGIIYCSEQCWSKDPDTVDNFNRKFVKLFYGIDDVDIIEWQYRISRPFVIVEKKYPKVYKLEEYGRIPMTVFEIAQNNELKENILEAQEVYTKSVDKVKWNKYNLKEWILGAKVRWFWYEVTRCYAEAAGNPENDESVNDNICYLDSQLSKLREDITSLLSETMPEKALEIKKVVFFNLYEELKKEMQVREFKHTGV